MSNKSSWNPSVSDDEAHLFHFSNVVKPKSASSKCVRPNSNVVYKKVKN